MLFSKKGKSKQTDSVSLDAKVDKFIDWHFKNMISPIYMGDEEGIRKSTEMRNFIEKMAVWYELRYPDYEVNRLIPWTAQGNADIDEIMFNSNSYINSSLDADNETRVLDWDAFYNADAFINSLPFKERCIFNRPRYSELVYIDADRGSAHLHLTPEGIVEEAEGIGAYSGYQIRDQQLYGMHIKDVVQMLKDGGAHLPVGNELEETINNVDNWIYQKEEMLNCVMYRLIERGGSIIGPRRAFLFATEFGRNIDVPMKYGVDYSDQGLRGFINEYIKAGGFQNLECFVDYFARPSKNATLDTTSVFSLLESTSYDRDTKYTPEERVLQQRMVNALASQIDPEELKREEVRELRLQRKLTKSKRNKD